MATVKTSFTADASDLNSKVDQAGEKVKKFAGHANEAHLSLRKVESALGIHFAIQIFEKMESAMKRIVELSEKGITLVSNSELANIKTAVSLVEELGMGIATFVAKGAGGIGALLKGSMSSIGILAGGGLGQSQEEHKAAVREAMLGTGDVEKRIEAEKRLKETRERIEESSGTNEEKMAAIIKHIEELEKEEIDIAAQRVVKNIAESDAKTKIINAEIKLLQLNKERRDLAAKMRKEEDDAQKKVVDELNKNFARREELEKRISRLHEDTQKEIKKIEHPAAGPVTAGHLAGAAQGMYVGGVDRSLVAQMSKKDVIQTRIKDILEEMNQREARMREDAEAYAGGD